MRLALLALPLALAAAPAFADDVMSGYYGNTVVSKGGIAEIHVHYRPDHSFDLTGSALGMTRSYKGTWALDGKGGICRTFVGDAPRNTPNPLCRPIAAHKVGDSWTIESNGTASTLTLVAGIE